MDKFMWPKALAEYIDERGPIRFQKKTDLLEDNKGRHYIWATVEGDDDDKAFYVAGDDDLQAEMRAAPKDQWITMRMDADRGLTVGKDAGGHSQQTSSSSSGGTATRPDDIDLYTTMQECLAASHDLMDWYEDTYGEPMAEHVQRMAVHFAIEHYKRGTTIQNIASQEATEEQDFRIAELFSDVRQHLDDATSKKINNAMARGMTQEEAAKTIAFLESKKQEVSGDIGGDELPF